MTPSRIRPRLLLAAAVLLSAPGIASAQLDDPGLEAPPPPPKPLLQKPPAAAPAVVVPPAAIPPRVQPQAQPRFVAPLPPAVRATAEPSIKEESKEEVSTSPADAMSDDEWEARLAAPSLFGSIGLLRMHTADVGRPLNFRVGSHLQAFTANSFIIAAVKDGAGRELLPGDENSRFLGDLTVGLTGPNLVLLRNLELYLAIINSSNQNKRVDAGRTDPTVILALADVALGLKGAGAAYKGLSIGGNLNVRFFNSISGVTANFDATSVAIDLLAGLDVRAWAPKVPLRFHLNLGYYLDRSLAVLPAGQCAQSTGNDACIRSRIVETFAYGLGMQRLRIALGVELPFRPHVPWGIFGIALFGEFHYERGVGDGDTTVVKALGNVVVPAERVTGANISYLTVGVRLRPVARLVLDVGADVGLIHPGYRYGPPLPQWNIIFGAAYTYDTAGGTKVIKRTLTRTIAIDRTPAEGRLRGVVRDSKSKKPLAGAIVSYQGRQLSPQVTDENGVFVSYGLPPGSVNLDITRGDDYLAASTSAEVTVNGETPLEVMLAARPPKESKVRVKVRDEKGGAVLGGQVMLVGPVSREAVGDGDGFVTQVPAGDYTVSMDAPGYLAREKQIVVAVGRDQTIELRVQKRPKVSRVQVVKDQIVIKGVIHFGTNNATILPDGQQLLDEVADALAKGRQIRRVSIEGHTDNRGAAEKNMKLSKDRAKAVLDYLVKSGISPDRLTSDGFGATKPLVPNMTPSNRAKNRRVEFRILDQGAAL